MYAYDKEYRKETSMSVIAAAVKLTLCENKLRHSFQENIIAYSLRICNLENYAPKKRYIALCILYVDRE